LMIHRASMIRIGPVLRKARSVTGSFDEGVTWVVSRRVVLYEIDRGIAGFAISFAA
jgi:hypothetical protein